MQKTPHELGYKMPAEWEKHEGTWLTWPKDDTTFPAKFLEQIQDCYIDLISMIKKSEKVFILIENKEFEDILCSKLEKKGIDKKNIIFHQIEYADTWIRDYGPIFIKNKNKVAAVKWIFNTWGNKYGYFVHDNETGEKIAKTLESKMPVFRPQIVLEGGSVDTNGSGIFLTTEQCLLNKNRNPSLKKHDIEEYIKSYLGAEKIIWLKNGIEGDDTDGHVDDFARFVNENTVLLAMEENKHANNFISLNKNLKILENTKIRDEKLEIVKLPMPNEIRIGKRIVPASYANFYITNKSVIVPVFNDKNDKIAIEVIQKVFPKKEILPLYSTPFVVHYGAVHCATQQQPV